MIRLLGVEFREGCRASDLPKVSSNGLDDTYLQSCSNGASKYFSGPSYCIVVRLVDPFPYASS